MHLFSVVLLSLRRLTLGINIGMQLHVNLRGMITDLDYYREIQTNQNVIKLENEKQIKQLQRKRVSPPFPYQIIGRGIQQN
jgi:hypothetical protein